VYEAEGAVALIDQEPIRAQALHSSRTRSVETVLDIDVDRSMIQAI
jgi:hypothetical protein